MTVIRVKGFYKGSLVGEYTAAEVAQLLDYPIEDVKVQIIDGEATFDKKAEEDSRKHQEAYGYDLNESINDKRMSG
jgi:hypothetical protein